MWRSVFKARDRWHDEQGRRIDVRAHVPLLAQGVQKFHEQITSPHSGTHICLSLCAQRIYARSFVMSIPSGGNTIKVARKSARAFLGILELWRCRRNGVLCWKCCELNSLFSMNNIEFVVSNTFVVVLLFSDGLLWKNMHDTLVGSKGNL